MGNKIILYLIRAGVLTGLLVLIFLTVFFDELSYGITQWQGQRQIIDKSKPLRYYLENTSYPDSLKEKIRLVQEIRQYAVDSLGIKDSECYKKVFDQKGEAVLWNVMACDKYSLNSVQWTYPIAGTFPYRGRFDFETAIREKNYYDNQGYDAAIRIVPAWSTLGLYDDPILSNTLFRSEGELAELIIHEMTHLTIYVYSDGTFNENLATFIGESGAKKFLLQKYGADSEELNEYLLTSVDQEKRSAHILRGAHLLDSLYNTFNDSIPNDKKDRLKYDLIGQVVNNLDTIDFFNPLYGNTVYKDSLPDNTFFAGYLRYHSKKDSIRTEFTEKFNSDFSKYFEYLKETYPVL